MRRFLIQSFSIFAVVLLMGVFGVVQAASLDFDSATSTIDVDETFTIMVKIDAGTEQIAGTDIYIGYDDELLDLQSVTGLDYFPIVGNTPEVNRLYIYGVVANSGEFKTGAGDIATLVFKGVKEGTAELKFDCDLSKTITSKIAKNDINATNIIDCSALGLHTVTIGAGTGDGGTGDTPPSLPVSGAYEKVIQYSMYGGVLLLVGLALRLMLHI